MNINNDLFNNPEQNWDRLVPRAAWNRLVDLSENEILRIEDCRRVDLFNRAICDLSEYCNYLEISSLSSLYEGKTFPSILGKLIRCIPAECTKHHALPKILNCLRDSGVFFENSLWNYLPFCAKSPNPILTKALEDHIISGNELPVVKLIEHGFPLTPHLIQLTCQFERYDVLQAIIKITSSDVSLAGKFFSVVWDVIGLSENETAFVKMLLQNASALARNAFFQLAYKTSPEKALQLACSYGFVDIARELIAKGVNLNDPSLEQSILFTACQNSPELILELMGQGAVLSYSEALKLPHVIQNMESEFDRTARTELFKICFSLLPFETIVRAEKFNLDDELLFQYIKKHLCIHGVEFIRRLQLRDDRFLKEYLNLVCIKTELYDLIELGVELNVLGFSEWKYKPIKVLFEHFNSDLKELGLKEKLNVIDSIQIADVKLKKITFLIEAIYLKKILLAEKPVTQNIKDYCVETYIFSRPDLNLALLREGFLLWHHPDHAKFAAALPAFKFAWEQLFRERLISLLSIGVQPQVIHDVLEKMKKIEGFRDGKNMQVFIDFLYNLSANTTITVEKKGEILLRIFTEGYEKAKQIVKVKIINEIKSKGLNECELKIKTMDNHLQGKEVIPSNREFGAAVLMNIFAAAGMLSLGYDITMFNSTVKSLQETFGAAFTDFLPLGHIQDFNEKYGETFQSCRMPSAILTYATKIKSLDDQKSLDCLVSYISSVLNGDFHQRRYALENNPHLTALHQIQPNAIALWRKNMESISIESEPSFITSNSVNMWLYQTFMGMDFFQCRTAASQLSILKCYLDAPDKMKSDFRKECSTEWEKIKKVKIISNDQKISKNCLKLQELLFQLIETQNVNKQLGLIRAIKNLLTQDLSLKYLSITDVDVLAKPLKASQKPIIVEESDDPMDLLLCGTEVADSCQHVSKSAGFNKGLLGYLVDGKNKLLVIRDSEGRIAARCLIRLMIQKGSETDDKIVVYREIFYPNNISVEYQKAFNQMAMAKAKSLAQVQCFAL